MIEVLHTSNDKSASIQEVSGNWSGFKEATGKSLRMSSAKSREGDQNVEQLSNQDHVTTNASSSQFEAQLYIVGDKEAVIKMIIKRRSPMMRHVSSHWVASNWLFDRINLDPKIQIKHFGTKNQFADMLTKCTLTRDEWDHLLRLSRIWNFSTFSCSHFLSKKKAACHVQESSGNWDRTRSCGGKAEADDIRIKKPLERKANFFYRFGCFKEARKPVRSGECESSGSTGKPVRGIDDQLERTRLE